MRCLCSVLLVALLLGCGATSPPSPPTATAPPPTLGVAGPFTLVSQPAGRGQLILHAGLDGTPGQPIASGVNNPVCAVADSLFYTAATSSSSQLVRFSLESGAATVLVDDAEATLSQTACSAGSDQLLYLRKPTALIDDEPAPPHIWGSDTAGAPPAQFHAESALNAAFSPDGRAVVFELADSPYLLLRDPAGTLRRLDYVGTYSWSPDSQRLVVAQLESLETGRFARLVLYDVASGLTTTLLDDPAADVYYPRWSPDGQRIAFVRRPLGAEHGELWALPLAEPAAARQISDDAAYDNFDPQWSPDSQSLLWSRVLPTLNRFSVWHQRLDAAAPSLVADDALWPRWIDK